MIHYARGAAVLGDACATPVHAPPPVVQAPPPVVQAPPPGVQASLPGHEAEQARDRPRADIRIVGTRHAEEPARGAAPPAARHGGGYRRGPKSVLDLVLCFLLLPVTAPLIALFALVVACDGGRPFYSQERVGRGGRVFRMWKLRTMVVDAERALETHLGRDAAMREEWRVHQKIVGDPRITPVGRFLRRSSMDELPQIWNVIVGEMSFVGPRPMMVAQRPLYLGTDYYELRPGITGLWQISERNASSFGARAGFDATYNQELCLSLDLAILCGTVRAVLGGTGH